MEKIETLPTRDNSEYSSGFDRDSKYWDSYYSKALAPEEPSCFAQWVLPKLERQKDILDLGCGNGRDSVFFCNNGLNVTAIDASTSVIKTLENTARGDSIRFVCGDFVCSPDVFEKKYEYCYSRFSLHAINSEQEMKVLGNVHKALKDGGKFFIETRSVNDEIYGKGEKVGKDSYYYNGHFRRFIRKECLLERLKEMGYGIEYESEERNFAPFGDANPLIIRIIAIKRQP